MMTSSFGVRVDVEDHVKTRFVNNDPYGCVVVRYRAEVLAEALRPHTRKWLSATTPQYYGGRHTKYTIILRCTIIRI